MRRYHEILIHHKFRQSNSIVRNLTTLWRCKFCGNHRLEENMLTHQRDYFYHNTCIVSVNEDDKTLTINNGGWDTLSTRTAIHGYVCYYKNLGYSVTYAPTHVGRKDW